MKSSDVQSTSETSDSVSVRISAGGQDTESVQQIKEVELGWRGARETCGYSHLCHSE